MKVLKNVYLLTFLNSHVYTALHYTVFQVRILDKCFEITSLVGTICKDGAHLHVTLGDSDGNTVAGHVFGDLIVQTTAEVILGEVCGLQFRREFDNATGYSELVISKCEDMK